VEKDGHHFTGVLHLVILLRLDRTVDPIPLPWHRPKVAGKARPILDANGRPVKSRGNRDQAFALWSERMARRGDPGKGLANRSIRVPESAALPRVIPPA